MMRWTKGDIGFESKENTRAVDAVAEERLAPGLLFAQVIQSLAMVLSRVGVTSLMLLVVAVVVATVLFGLSAGDAMAFGQWCRKC